MARRERDLSALIQPWRSRGFVFAVAVGAFWWLVLADSNWWFHSFPKPPMPADFQLYFDAARIGVNHGWNHIYDSGLQRIEFYHVRPSSDVFDVATYFVTAPLIAWLLAPTAAILSYPAAYWLFFAILAAAYVTTGWLVTPGSRLAKAAVVLAGATTYPVLITLAMGQVTLLVGVAVVLAWILLRRGHEVAAGLALSAIFLKPQVAYLVPLALFAWGSWRSVFVAGGATVVLLLLTVLSLGGAGMAAWSHALIAENQHLDNQIWTPAIFTGAGTLAYVVEAAAAAITIAIAVLARHRRDPGTAIVAGLVGSLLAAPYHHGADSFCLVAAFWIALNLRPSRLLSFCLAAGVVAAFFEPPTGPGPLLLCAAGWLLVLLYEEIRARAPSAPREEMTPTEWPLLSARRPQGAARLPAQRT
jgi:hypothetical protein